MQIHRMLKYLGPKLIFQSMTMLFVLTGMSYAQINDIDEAGCAQSNGIWIPATKGVNGDGGPAVSITASGPGNSQFLGGHSRGFRQNIDNTWTFSCPMNPAQPPTVANSASRQCTPPGNDMTVERCNVVASALTCEYVNSKNAPVKFVELGACYKMPPPKPADK